MAIGIRVISSANVPDEALLVTRDIVRHMLLKRPDLRADIIQRGGRVGVMAVTEMTTDIPEQRDWKKPALDMQVEAKSDAAKAGTADEAGAP